MKSARRTAWILAGILILLGVVLGTGAMLAMSFDFSQMDTSASITNNYTVTDVFSSIIVDTAEAHIRLVSAQDGVCRVECRESRQIFHTVTVENGTLTIRRKDQRPWYAHIGMAFGGMEVTVYLPDTAYGHLQLCSVSGEVRVPAGFHFEMADVRSTSGTIRFAAGVTDMLSAKTVSGAILLQEGAAGCDVQLKSTSGRIECAAVVENTLGAESVSGSVTLADCCCRSITIRSTSGGVRLNGCDADTIRIKTVSGGVSGTLRSKKRFTIRTTSGDVQVPASGDGGECQVQTTSGNIRLLIQES